MFEPLYRALSSSLPLSLVLVLLLAHMVGDFIFQSDWQATHKSKRWDALGLHVAVYISVVALIVAAFQPPSEFPYASLRLFVRWVIVNGLAHFVQDAITSRIAARLWFIRWHSWGTLVQPEKGGTRYVNTAEVLPTRHWFFVAIGADQLIHYITLFVTAGWWLR